MGQWTRELADAASGFSPSEQEQAAVRHRAKKEGANRRAVVMAPPPGCHGGGLTLDVREHGRFGRRKQALATGLLVAASFAAGGLAVAQIGQSEDDVASQYGLQSHPASPGDELSVTPDGLLINGTVIEDANCDPTQHPDK